MPGPTASTMPCCGRRLVRARGTTRPDWRMRSGSSSLMTTRSKRDAAPGACSALYEARPPACLASPPMPAPPAAVPPARRSRSSRGWARRSCGRTAPARATPGPAAGRRSSSRPGRRARRALRRRAAHDQQPDGVHRGARGPALAPAGSGLHRHRLAADARLHDEVDRRLEAQGLEDRGRRSGQEPGPRAGARRGDRRHADVRWHWVRGHETGAAHAHKALNDRADRLAVAAARAARFVDRNADGGW